MSDEDLLKIIQAHRADSLGVEDGQLSTERAGAMNHYHGRPYGNEVEGRSQVVSRDLAEAVDWVMPAIMKVFTQSGRIAEFDPVGPEDEQLALQESDYVNQVMMKDNSGFMVLHDAIKDTLLLKNGYAKHLWEDEKKIEEAEYTGLTMDQIAMMRSKVESCGGEFEIVGQRSYFLGEMPKVDSMGKPVGPMPVEHFDVKLKISQECGRLIWVATPSEEVRVSKKCRGSLQDSPFTEHVTRKTRSDLIEMGMPVEFVNGLAAYSGSQNSQQSFARDSTDDESDNTDQFNGDKSMDEIEYCEAYIKVDYDGDGIAELRKVVTCAGKIPPGDDWNEPLASVPMTGFVAKRVPHRHVGESLDDELKDLQEIMTVLKRQLLDNIYRVNNSEMAINDNANLRDFMTSTPGGIKRIKGKDPVGLAFASIVTAPIIDKILPVIDYFEASKETRTGISKATTGLDPDILQNTTKGAFIENLNRASQKVEMMTRMLAETGVKECVLQVHALLNRHQDQPRIVQMRGKWVPVNPREWKTRTDLTVRVGLGTGSEEEKRNKLQLLAGLQGQLLQSLGAAPPVVYEKMYTMFSDVAQTLGIDTPEKYAITPGSPEHIQIVQAAQNSQQQPGSDDLSRAAQIQADANIRIQSERTQAQVAIKAARDQFDRDLAAYKARAEALDRDRDRQLEVFLERMRLQAEAAQQAADRRSKEAIEAMKQEAMLIAKQTFADLGAPGISAGVQGSPGTDAVVSVREAGSGENPPADGEGMGREPARLR